jgi:DNA invertase Pin-like site-specific DNA recombinase
MQPTTRHHSRILPRTVVGYRRVSTDEQGEVGVSLHAQGAQISAFAAAVGYEIVALESDVISGAVNPERRPGFAAAMRRVTAREADGLIVSKLDRLSRSTMDFLGLLHRSQREGWELVSVNEQIDTGSASGRFTVTVFAAMAEMERGLIAERTLAAMAQIAREGRARSSRLPFGFRIDGEPDGTTLRKGDRRPLVPHDGEQRVLVKILRLRRAGRGGHAIATSLNRRQEFNPRTGRPWSVGGVRALIATVERRAAAG